MYEAEIATIAADLRIEDVTIQWVWVPKKFLKTSKKYSRWGQHTPLGDRRGKIELATVGWDRKGMIWHIAHEMRHAAQKRHGWSRIENGLHVWTGTAFAAPMTYKGLEYWQQPEEKDARAYENDAWVRLFAGNTRTRVDTTAEHARLMFRKARRDADAL